MKSFDQFLDALHEGHRNAGKTGLYPLGYDGIGNYPPADIITSSADAIYYLSVDDRFASWWEGSPFDISHIPGKPVEPKEHGMPGILKPPRESKMPGKPTKPKGHGMPGVEKKPGESPLPGAPTRDCIVKKPTLLNPHLAGKGAEKSICDKEIWKLPD
jgi:hypothetical protein